MTQPSPPHSIRCELTGHDISFRAEGTMMTWQCRRGCGQHGSKTYPTPAESTRFAAAFNKRDSEGLGRRAPLIGLFPLRLWRWWRTHR